MGSGGVSVVPVVNQWKLVGSLPPVLGEGGVALFPCFERLMCWVYCSSDVVERWSDPSGALMRVH
jgi:hypothetical protein